VGSSTELVRSTFQSNEARGGTASQLSRGGDAFGGAIQNLSSLLSIQRCDFEKNLAQGGAARTAAKRGAAAGGAIYSDPAGGLRMFDSSVRRNRALGSIGQGGGLYLSGLGAAQLVDCVIARNEATTEGDNIFGPYV